MAFSYYDMVKASTATTGTGSITVGSAVAPYRAFSGVVANGATIRYLILDGSAWERGYGTYTSSTGVLTRTLECSSTGSLLSLSGAATVENVAGAADFDGGPAFSAYSSTDQTGIGNVALTKVRYNTENFDTANCYDSGTNYRFTPNVAGYYQFNWCVFLMGTISNYEASLFKNGAYAQVGSSYSSASASAVFQGGSTLLYMNGTTDYVEVFTQATVSGTMTAKGGATYTTFSGFLARAA